MTEILCNWLNNEVKLTQIINNDNFAESFSNGYLIGEILSKYGLFDNFDDLTNKNTSDGKLKNFIVLEPTLKLLGITFNKSIATDVMIAKTSVLVNLMYELFIVLDRKRKSNLTALSIKSMQAPATTKLQEMESNLFQQRITKVTPRQSDLNLQEVIEKYQEHQIKMREKAERERILSAEGHQKDTEIHRKNRLNRSKQIQAEQEEQRRKIDAATVEIPKQPPNKTLTAIKKRNKALNQKEAEKAMRELDEFEQRKSREAGNKPVDDKLDKLEREESFSISDTGSEDKMMSLVSKNASTIHDRNLRDDLVEYLRLGNNEEYVGKIRTRLESDKEARIAREKRRRKVLMNCLKSHFEQEENERDNMVAMRLMRQSQMERRIAVQLLQLRHEKEIIKSNRMERERQYQERREKEFLNCLDKEQEILRQVRLGNKESLKAEQELYNAKRTEYKMKKYKKHYEMAERMVYDIIDLSFKYKEFDILTEGNIPPKLISDWKTAFIHGVPIFDKVDYDEEDEEEVEEKFGVIGSEYTKESGDDEENLGVDLGGKSTAVSRNTGRKSKLHVIQIQDVEVPVPTPFSDISSKSELKNKLEVLDNEDFLEYQQSLGDWIKDEQLAEKPTPINTILDWIVDRIIKLSEPADDNAKLAGLPEFPIKAAVLGKCFSGKTSVIRNLVKNNRCVSIIPQEVINEALEAFSNDEEIEVKIPIIPDISSSPAEIDGTKIDEDKTENLITDINLNSSMNEAPLTHIEEEVLIANDAGIGQPCVASTQPLPKEVYEVKYEASPRAILGKLVQDELMSGRPVNDFLLVDLILEYIRRIPDGTGWVLDDFPATYQQAKLFEQAIINGTSNGPDNASEPKSRASSRKNKTPLPPKDSFFDVIIMLDTSDRVCLERALESSEQQLAKENISTVNTSKNVIANIQTSLSKFSESWPKLSKFYNKIKENLIRVVDSSETRSATEVYLQVESILDELIVLKSTPIPPPAEFEELPVIPPIEMEPTLEIQTPTTDLDVDLGSKEVLTSKKSIKRKKSKGGSKPSSRASSAGSKGSDKKSTGTHKSRNKSRTDDTSKKSNKKDTDSKKGSSKKSTSKDSASGGKRKVSGRSSTRSSRSGSGKGKKSKSVSKEERKEETVVVTEIPEPRPGDVDWVYADKPLDQEISMTLADYWEALNNVYSTNCKSVFREIRFDREEIIRYMHAVRSAFRQFLDRPDAKQEYLDQYQKEYNDLADEWRSDEEVQQEWHQKVTELKEELYEISQENQQEAEGELEKIKSNIWLEDKVGILSNEYLNLMQHELDRFQDVVKLLRDYYKSMVNKGTGLDEFKPEFLRLPVIQIPVEIEASKEEEDENEKTEIAKMSPKLTTPIPKKSVVTKSSSKPVDPLDISGDIDEETENLFQTKIPLVEYKTQSSQIMSTTITNVPVPAKTGKPEKGAAAPAGSAGISLLKLLASGKLEKKGGDKSATERDTIQPPTDPDCRFVYDTAMCCLTIISGILEYEISQAGPKEEADKPGGAGDKGGKDKSGDKKGGKGKKSRTPTPKKGSKDKTSASAKKPKSRSPSAKSGKGGKSKSKRTPDKDAVVPNKDSEESVEDKQNRLFIEKVKVEYLAALQKEALVVRYNIERVMKKGVKMIDFVKQRIDSVFKLISVWIADKLLTEDSSIKNMETVLRYHIETKQPVKEKMEIIKNKFFLNPIKDDEEPIVSDRPPSPIDPVGDNYFTVSQLKQLYELFNQSAEANNDSMSLFDFNRLLMEFITSIILNTTPNSMTNQNAATIDAPQNISTPTTPVKKSSSSPLLTNDVQKLPQFIRHFVQVQSTPTSSANTPTIRYTSLEGVINQLAELFSCDHHYVNWRLFMLAVAEPWPWPSQSELLETLARFRNLDQLGSGCVTRQQYEFLELWFDVGMETGAVDLAINEQQIINRSSEVKSLFFNVFKVIETSDQDQLKVENLENEDGVANVEYLNYEDMLLHFAIFTTHNFYHGISRALSVVIGNHISGNFQIPSKESGRESETKRDDEEEDVFIPINALYRILSFGHIKPKFPPIDIGKVDLEDAESERDASLIKSLKGIYENCEHDNSDIHSVEFSRLLKHEGLWEWFNTCHWFHYIDVRNLFLEAPTAMGSSCTPVE